MTELEFALPYQSLDNAYKLLGKKQDWYFAFKNYHTLDVVAGVTDMITELDQKEIRPATLTPFVRDARSRRVGMVIRKDQEVQFYSWADTKLANGIPPDVTEAQWDRAQTRVMFAARKIILSDAPRSFDYLTFIAEGRDIVSNVNDKQTKVTDEFSAPDFDRPQWIRDWERKQIEETFEIKFKSEKQL